MPQLDKARWSIGRLRGRMRKLELIAVIAACAGLAGIALASETVTYSYDAKGRLIKVVHTGSVENGMTSQYTLDHANNRTNVKVTGAH